MRIVGVLLPAVAAAAFVGVVHMLAAYFRGIGPRVWAFVLALGAIAAVVVAAMLGWRLHTAELRATTCTVIAPTSRDAGEDTIEVVAKVRWIGEGKRYTSKRPMVVARGGPDEGAALLVRHAAGTQLACSYRVARPNWIELRSVADRQRGERWLAVMFLLVAPLVGYAAHRMSRRRTAARGVRLTGVRGVAGLAAVAGIVAGMLLDGTAGLVLGIPAAALFVTLIAIESVRALSAFERVRTKLGAGEAESDRVRGTWRGREVSVAQESEAIVVTRPLPVPDGLSLERRGDATPAGTGDGAFDRVIAVHGAEELWRPVLASALRAQLARVFETWDARLASGTLVVRLDDAEAHQVEAVLDAVAELDITPVPSDREARVFELATAEPVAAVRFGHYRWLVARGWNAPHVFRAAAADPDPDVATWGKEQLPPETGAFR